MNRKQLFDIHTHAEHCNPDEIVYKHEDLISLPNWLQLQQQFCKICVPKATFSSSLIHLGKELNELQNSITLPETKECILKEYVDVILCAASSALQFGFTPEEIQAAIEEKIHENLFVRKWKENPDGTYSHVK